MTKRKGDGGKQLLGLRRGVDVVRIMAARREGMSFGELVERSGMNDPTLSRLLRVLVDMGFVDKDAATGLYAVGGEAVAFARALLGSIPTEQIVQPVVDALASRSGESAAYFELDGDDVVLRAKREHADSFHYMAVYGRSKKWVHGFTQAPMAFLSDAERGPYRARLPDADAIAARELKRRWADVRERLVYVDEGESNPGAVRITAPVFMGPGGRVLGSIGITVLSGGGLDGARRATYGELVELAGRQASERLATRGTTEGTNDDG